MVYRRSRKGKARRVIRRKSVSKRYGRRRYSGGARKAKRGYRRVASSKSFALKVKKALERVGSKNYYQLAENTDIAPFLGYQPLSNAQYTAGQWWNASGGQGGVPILEMTQLIPYNSNPGFSQKDTTRQSTRVRISKIEIFGIMRHAPNLVPNALFGEPYVDVRPTLWMPTRTCNKTFPNPTDQSSLNMGTLIADHAGISATTTMSAFNPETWTSGWPKEIQKGQHNYDRIAIGHFSRIRGIKEGLETVPATNNVLTGYTIPENPPSVMSGSNHFHWILPVDRVFDYSRTTSENAPVPDAVANTPLFLAWEGRASAGIYQYCTANPAVTVTLGVWRHFHVFVHFEDIYGANY